MKLFLQDLLSMGLFLAYNPWQGFAKELTKLYPETAPDKTDRQGIKDLEDDERRVNRGGAAAKGRYALDRVLDFIAEEEALKERQEKARLEAEALRR